MTVSNSSLPRVMCLEQVFPARPPLDIPSQLRDGFSSLAGHTPIYPIQAGARIGIAVGSRGISDLQLVVKEVIARLREAGAAPFIIPAMGSHGGATAEGQIQLLADYGISESQLDVPVHAAMEADRIGVTPQGVGVFCGQEALKADGVVLVNRIKPHTDFSSETLGSGLLKMLVVGLGKRAGAANYHALASRFGYERILRESADIALKSLRILCGIGIVEDQAHRIARVEVISPEQFAQRESELFSEAKQLMPQFPFDEIDLLIVDRLGKNISGAGMDPNVIGRSLHGYSALLSEQKGRPIVRRIFVRELTPETHGNVVGIGMADFTTTRLVRSMNHETSVLNAMTALSLQSVKVPIHFETDREAVEKALQSLALPDVNTARVVRIRDTLSLGRLEVSESLAASVRDRPDLKCDGEAAEMGFDAAGNLAPMR